MHGEEFLFDEGLGELEDLLGRGLELGGAQVEAVVDLGRGVGGTD